jgi:hypothetical protein
MSYPRRSFVVRVRAGDGSVVVEDVQTGERARLPDLSAVETQIRTWLAELPEATVSALREERET